MPQSEMERTPFHEAVGNHREIETGPERQNGGKGAVGGPHGGKQECACMGKAHEGQLVAA